MPRSVPAPAVARASGGASASTVLAGVCRRVVLDSVYFRHAPAYLLRELVARGFKLQVSWIAFGELWAKAGRDGDLEVLASRVRALDRVVDPNDPLHPTGVQLIHRLGGTVRGSNLVRPHEQFLARGGEFWRQLVDGTGDAKSVLARGSIVDAEIDCDAAGWLRANEDAVQLGERSRAFPEEDVVRGVTAHLVKEFSTQASVRHGVQERFHGYYRSVALHAVRAWKRKNRLLPKVDENDNEDAQLPMHIGDGAFVATLDLNFIEHFDACGTFQAPWLRTIGELLTAPLPLGKPWGKAARRAAREHSPRDRGALVQLEDRVRTEFRPSQTV